MKHLGAEDAARARALDREGHTNEEIADMLGVSHQTVWRIVNGRGAYAVRAYVRPHRPARPNAYPDCLAKLTAGR